MLIPFRNILFKKNLKGIIHIGAHECEELSEYIKKKIMNVIWIEANPEKYQIIESKITKYKNMILGKFAAGSNEKKSFLNIANNGQSSSLLELGTHQYSYPKIFYKNSVIVPVKPLDEWMSKKIITRDDYNFLNIDIQGYELEALKGMQNQLKFVDYVYLEVNFREVYLNCSQLKEIDIFLDQYQFKRVGIYRTNKGWGDALFVKDFININKIYYFFLVPILKIITLPSKLIKKIYFLLKNINLKG